MTTRSRHPPQKTHYIDFDNVKKAGLTGTGDTTKVTDITNIPTAKLKKVGKKKPARNIQTKKFSKGHYLSISPARTKTDGSPKEAKYAESLGDNEAQTKHKRKSKFIPNKCVRNTIFAFVAVVLVAACAVGIYFIYDEVVNSKT